MSDPYLIGVNPDNLVNVVRDLVEKVKQMDQRPVAFNALDEITSDLGDQRAGRFLALASGVEPTDSEANGAFLSALGEHFGEFLMSLGVVKNGQIQFGFGPDAAVFAAGRGIINSEGILLDGLNYVIRQTAENNGNARIGKLMMTLPSGGSRPVFALDLSAPLTTESLVNGGAETGDFTGWTKTEETRGVWEISENHAGDGSNSFSFRQTAGTPDSGVLTSEPISVTALTNYLVSGKTAASVYSGFPLPSRKAEVIWYDNTGAVLRTDVLFSVSDNYEAWQSFELTFTAPAGATAARMRFTSWRSNGDKLTSYYDDFSFSSVGVSSRLWLDDDGIHSSNGGMVICKNTLPVPDSIPQLQTPTSGGNIEAGVYRYGCSYLDSFGETKIRATSAYVSFGSPMYATLTIPTGGQTVTGRKIYRTKKGPGSTYYLVGTVNDNTTTTFVDNVADANLGAEAPQVNTSTTRPILPTRALVRWKVDAQCKFRTGDTWNYESLVTGPYAFKAYGTISGAADFDQYKFDVFLAPGTYKMYIHAVKVGTGGKVDFYEDGSATPFASGVDLYGGGVAAEIIVSNCVLKNAGLNQISAIVNGKNTSSTGYQVFIADIEFVATGIIG